MSILVVVPTREEIDCLLKGCGGHGLEAEDAVVGRLPVMRFDDLQMTVACGGLGKVQFAVQAQHLLDVCPDWELVVCAGAAGALVDELSVGDVVVSTETVEHDIDNRFGRRHLPRFVAASAAVDELRRVSQAVDSFRVYFGPIASGDEDVTDPDRRRELRELTGGLAVAWEGAGGARACRFSDVPFAEIRGVTDRADGNAASDYEANLAPAMASVADLLIRWARARYP